MTYDRIGSRSAVVISLMLCCMLSSKHVYSYAPCDYDTIGSFLDQEDVEKKAEDASRDVLSSKKYHSQLKTLFISSLITSGISMHAQDAVQNNNTTNIMDIVNTDKVDMLRNTYPTIKVYIHNGTETEWAKVCREHGGMKGDSYKHVGAFVNEEGEMYYGDSTAFYLDYAHELVHALETDPYESLQHLQELNEMINKRSKRASKELKNALNDLLIFIEDNVPKESLGPSWKDPTELLPLAREFYAYYYQFLSLGLLNDALTEYQRSFLGEFAEEFIAKMYAFHEKLAMHEDLFAFLMSYYREKGLLTDLRITFYADGTYDTVDNALAIDENNDPVQASYDVPSLQSA